jgi:RNA polymerase sigma-70 factor (ECF subfamily)
VESGEIDDTGLLLAAARGDQQAFACFYRRWLPVVTGYHLRRSGGADLAFDLTAETFAALIEGLDSFDPRRGSAPGWLFGIAAHKLSDSRRRARVEASARASLRMQPVILEDEDLDRVEELALADGSCLERLLADLPAQQREAVIARVLGELSYAEVAVGLRCSEQVARQRVHRGLRRLRELLREPA